MMTRTFKVLSLLLTYPTAELQEAVPDMAAALEAEGLLPARQRRALGGLFRDLAGGDLYDLQERYVTLFDRTRSLSLHLFEHVHGESRDRGQALVDLQKLYDGNGLVVAANELPDFLPLFLEYLSTRPVEEACELLGEPLHILTVLEERLNRRRSVYVVVLRALLVLARGGADTGKLAELRAVEDDDPADLEALDRAWAEEPVVFGPGEESGCGKASILQRLAAGRTAASPSATKGSQP